MCKVYVSLCQINKSVEVDYYKVHTYLLLTFMPEFTASLSTFRSQWRD